MKEVKSAFHVIGFENADELLMKAQLMRAIDEIVTERKLTRAAAGKAMGWAASDVSNLLNGRIDRFTLDRLVRALRQLNPSLHPRIIFDSLPEASEVSA